MSCCNCTISLKFLSRDKFFSFIGISTFATKSNILNGKVAKTAFSELHVRPFDSHLNIQTLGITVSTSKHLNFGTEESITN